MFIAALASVGLALGILPFGGLTPNASQLKVTQYPDGLTTQDVREIALGPDGAVWYTEFQKA
jgi:streptogramin lyase